MSGLLDLFKPAWERYPSPPVSEYSNPLELVAKLGEDAKARGGASTWVGGTTDSMLPVIARGDSIIFIKKKPEEWKEGDIVMYSAPWLNSNCTAHRLVSRDKAGWIASGDNNKRSEPQGRVTAENYQGTIVSIHRLNPKKK